MDEAFSCEIGLSRFASEFFGIVAVASARVVNADSKAIPEFVAPDGRRGEPISTNSSLIEHNSLSNRAKNGRRMCHTGLGQRRKHFQP